MNSISRERFIEELNDYTFDDNGSSTREIIDILNTLLDSENYYNYLDLIFIAIANTQMYGFLSYLKETEQNAFFECDYFRSNSYRGIEIPFYNRGQLSFLYELDRYSKVFFSAPTSFGKTSIITEYILNNYMALNNIVFVVPTNSLLEELLEKFSVYNAKLNLGYNVTTKPSSNISGKNIFFLTPERFMIVAESDMINRFDLIVMDEAYKIVGADNEKISDFVNNRALRFRKVADLIGSTKNKVVFLSPFTYSLTDSMNRFLSKYSIKKVDRKLEYVKREIILLNSPSDMTQYFGNQLKNYQKNSTISHKAKQIVAKLYPSSTIIYVPNYSQAYKTASSIDFSCIGQKTSSRYNAFLHHIKENYLIDGRDSWTVYDALKRGIGIYISPLPRYVKKEIIKLYEEKVLTVLIVTSAFTEGVNTCASNLVFTSLTNGPNTNKLSDIDILNVSGRAGRFAKNTTGRVFCIKPDIYDKVTTLQESNDIKLENYNYSRSNKRIDFEIEMMDVEYLSDEQKELLKNQQRVMDKFGLSRNDLNVSLNISNQWKLILYAHFMSLNSSQLTEVSNAIKAFYEQETGIRIDSLNYIFNDLNITFTKKQIDVFPHEAYEISPFDSKGGFTWGRLYQIYASETPKKIIENNIRFILMQYSDVVQNLKPKKKGEIKELFAENNAIWILKYFNDDLSLNMNSFYAETFKIVSNIIQYKIPLYLAFYVSIFKLFIKKQGIHEINTTSFDINKLVLIFEEGETIDDYEKLLDYGLPLSTVTKMTENNISIEAIKNLKYDSSKFDDYENILISEVVNLL